MHEEVANVGLESLYPMRFGPLLPRCPCGGEHPMDSHPLCQRCGKGKVREGDNEDYTCPRCGEAETSEEGEL